MIHLSTHGREHQLSVYDQTGFLFDGEAFHRGVEFEGADISPRRGKSIYAE